MMLFLAWNMITSETWSYDPDGNVWTKLQVSVAPPAPRQGEFAVFDPMSGSAILYGGTQVGATVVNGGASGRVVYSDVWRFTTTQSSGQ